MKFKVESIRNLSLYVKESAYLENNKDVFHKTTEETLVTDVKEWLYNNLIKESGFHYCVKSWLLSSKDKKEGPIVVSVIVSIMQPNGELKKVKGTIVVQLGYSVFERIKRWFTKKYNNFISGLANM